jgi:hypothetical protein
MIGMTTVLATHAVVITGLDPVIHHSSPREKFCEEDGLPGQARQ